MLSKVVIFAFRLLDRYSNACSARACSYCNGKRSFSTAEILTICSSFDNLHCLFLGLKTYMKGEGFADDELLLFESEVLEERFNKIEANFR